MAVIRTVRKVFTLDVPTQRDIEYIMGLGIYKSEAEMVRDAIHLLSEHYKQEQQRKKEEARSKKREGREKE